MQRISDSAIHPHSLFKWSCGLLLGCWMAALQAAPMVVIQGDLPPQQDPKNGYRAELYRLLLESTRAEFGDYELRSYTQAAAARRQAQLLGEGEQLNVHWASPGTPVSMGNVIQIPVDIQRGLLGYRVCLTTESSRAPWQSVVDINSLRQIRIGQVDSWPDFDIYRTNHLNITGTPSLGGLYAMLASNRFDCLALGADEVQTIYRAQKPLIPALRVESSLLIYYEFPVYFYVSGKHPEIARRLRRGFEIIQQNGEFDRLFERYFAQDLAQLQLPKRQLVCLISPFIAPAEQCRHPERLGYYRH